MALRDLNPAIRTPRAALSIAQLLSRRVLSSRASIADPENGAPKGTILRTFLCDFVAALPQVEISRGIEPLDSTAVMAIIVAATWVLLQTIWI